MKKFIKSIPIALMIMSGVFVANAMEKEDALDAAIAASLAEMPGPDGEAKEDDDRGYKREIYELKPQEIPSAINLHILSFLPDPLDYAHLAEVCRCWRDMVKSCGNTIVIGSARSGKSTLTYLLAHKPLVAERIIAHPDDCGDHFWRLIAEEKIDNIHIKDNIYIHDCGRDLDTDTLKPSVVFDSLNKQFIWDCPGFRRRGGEERDWAKARAVHKLLKGNLRVILVVPFDDVRPHFQKLLDALQVMTEIFPNQGQLQNALSLVVSQISHKRWKFHNFLKLLSTGVYEPLRCRQEVSDLINFLIANPSHIADFREPQEEGRYEPSEDLKMLLQSRVYVSNPQVNAPDAPGKGRGFCAW